MMDEPMPRPVMGRPASSSFSVTMPVPAAAPEIVCVEGLVAVWWPIVEATNAN